MQKKTIVGSDISYASNTNYVNGLHRVIVETNSNLAKILNPDKYEFRTVNLSQSFKYLENEYLSRNLVINPSRNISFEDTNVVLLMDGNIDYAYKYLKKTASKIPVIALIHDLIPIFHPELTELGDEFKKLFRLYIMKILSIADHLIFTSQQTKNEFDSLGWAFDGSIDVIHLGAFNTIYLNKSVNSGIKVVVTNTIEPRKGYDDILDAFDLLLKSNNNIFLSIIGKYGWKSEGIKERILNHPEFENRLRWYTGITDEEMNKIYANSSISIVASHYEGFGLTLEEGLNYGNKVIAREIEVFKERSNENLYFFKGGAQELCTAILDVHSRDWNPVGLEHVRSMSDFAFDIKNIIELYSNALN